MQISLSEVITLLTVLVLVMAVILLYNLIFVSVSIKKIVTRWDDLSKEVEMLVLKPISAIEYVLDFFASAVEGMRDQQKHKKAHHHKKEKTIVEIVE